MVKIAVVGGGFAGAAMVCALLEKLPPGATISVFEPARELGGGVAYGKCASFHKLNVSEEKLRAFPDSPRTFLAWADRHKHDEMAQHRQMDGSFYFPRAWVGEYVRAEIEWRRKVSADVVSLEHLRSAAMAVAADKGGVVVTASDGVKRSFDAIVLAPGNPPPRPLDVESPDAARLPVLIQDPWADNAIESLQEGSSRLLVVGTGLTMADIVMTLIKCGSHSQVVAVSRHGYLPHKSVGRTSSYLSDAFPEQATLSAAVRQVREWCNESLAMNGDWRPGFEFARLSAGRLWRRLPLRERRRFCGRLRTLWDIHRYQMPPEAHEALSTLMHAGQLKVVRGRVRAVTSAGALILGPQGASYVACDIIVNATGPDWTFATSQAPLDQLLAATGLDVDVVAQQGLDVTPYGEVLHVAPELRGRVWALGSIARSTFGELTTVSDIGGLAHSMADPLVQRLALLAKENRTCERTI